MESNRVLVLDGGFSNELSKRCSYDVDKETLWTAKALQTDEKAVTETHLQYLKAGADIIETATYQATVKGLQESLRLSTEDCEALIGSSVKLAENAVTQFKSSQQRENDNRLPLIAGSIGPYGVYLHDGSEYSGAYVDKVCDKDIIELHAKRLQILGSSQCNLLALETTPSLREVEILLKFMAEKNIRKGVWTSFMLKENDASRTACGDLILDAFKTVAKYENVWGFGTNCVDPAKVDQFLEIASKAKNELGERGKRIRLIVYPNVGRKWVSGQGWSNEDVPALSEYARNWLQLGANVIGGCCQVGPEEIQKLRLLVDEWNSQSV